MKNAFYAMITKTLLVLEIFAFFSLLFRYVEIQLDNKANVNMKVYNVIA